MVNDFDNDIIIFALSLQAITFLPQVKDFDVAILNRLHQALVHVVVDLIYVEVWMVKDHLYQISQFCCVDIVLTNVILIQNVFAQWEDIGCIHIQWWQVSCRGIPALS